MNLIPGNRETSSRLPAFSLFPPEPVQTTGTVALLQQSSVVLQAEAQPDTMADWGHLQTFYGLIRLLHGGATLAWLGQGLLALALAIAVWLIWRSAARYALRAAVLSVAALLATPYAFSYDLAALAIPVAFLAKDQLQFGFLKGEQSLMLSLFGITLAALVVFGVSPHHLTFGSVPLGPIVSMLFLGMILRRTLRPTRGPVALAMTS